MTKIQYKALRSVVRRALRDASERCSPDCYDCDVEHARALAAAEAIGFFQKSDSLAHPIRRRRAGRGGRDSWYGR